MNYLSPWSHFRRFDKQHKQGILELLQKHKIDDIGTPFNIPEKDLRPALGRVGGELTTKAGEGFDAFIAEKVDKKEFYPHDQSDYFLTHSAMRDYEGDDEYFPRIYKESYQDNIMNVILGKGGNKTKSKFGKYE